MMVIGMTDKKAKKKTSSKKKEDTPKKPAPRSVSIVGGGQGGILTGMGTGTDRG